MKAANTCRYFILTLLLTVIYAEDVGVDIDSPAQQIRDATGDVDQTPTDIARENIGVVGSNPVTTTPNQVTTQICEANRLPAINVLGEGVGGACFIWTLEANLDFSVCQSLQNSFGTNAETESFRWSTTNAAGNFISSCCTVTANCLTSDGSSPPPCNQQASNDPCPYLATLLEQSVQSPVRPCQIVEFLVQQLSSISGGSILRQYFGSGSSGTLATSTGQCSSPNLP